MTKARDLANGATALSAVSATELAYLDGVTSAVQTQIDGKQAVNAAVSTTELGYLDGVTSAIQTQLDAKTAKSTLTTTGDIYYASSANTPARLGIGSSAQVLTVASGVPSWATPSAGALTLISATSFSASSAINVNNCFSATYENYLIMLNVTGGTCEDYVKVRLRVSGSDNSDSTYFWSWMGNASAYTAYDSQGGSSANGFQTYYKSASQNAYMGIMQMNNPFLSQRTSTNWQWSSMAGSSYNGIQQGGGVFNANTSFTGFSIVVPAGNITGKVAVYGYSI